VTVYTLLGLSAFQISHIVFYLATVLRLFFSTTLSLNLIFPLGAISLQSGFPEIDEPIAKDRPPSSHGILAENIS
jgi:hypothetical protein